MPQGQFYINGSSLETTGLNNLSVYNPGSLPVSTTWYNWRTNITSTMNFSKTSASIDDNTGIWTLSEDAVIYTPNNGFNQSFTTLEFVEKIDIRNAQVDYYTCGKIWLYNSYSNTAINGILRINNDNTYTLGYTQQPASGGSRVVWLDSSSQFYHISITNNPIIYLKTTMDSNNTVFYASFDGLSYIQFATLSSGSTTYPKIMHIKWPYKGEISVGLMIYLKDCYLKLDGNLYWQPYTETFDEVFTDTETPTTSSTVYSAPNTASELTITSVGTGTITCSDTKTYNRNSEGDIVTS